MKQNVIIYFEMWISYWMWKCLLLVIIFAAAAATVFYYKYNYTISFFPAANIPMRKLRGDVSTGYCLTNQTHIPLWPKPNVLMFNVVSTMKIWWASIFSLKCNENTTTAITTEKKNINYITHSVLFNRLCLWYKQDKKLN